MKERQFKRCVFAFALPLLMMVGFLPAQAVAEAMDNASGGRQVAPYGADAKAVAEDEAQVTATVILDGRELEPGEFSFELVNEAGRTIQTATNDADGNVAFAPIAFTRSDAGKFISYTVNEVVGVDGSVTYDESIFFVDVAVSLADDGSLVCTVFYPHGEPTFRNVCTAPACI